MIEKLGMSFVRVMPDMAPNASQDFMRVVDAERQGRVRAGRGDQPARLGQLCYGKDAAGAWKIVGMIGGE